MVRVGFIGVGGIARQHLLRLEKMSDVELVAFSDIVYERAKEVADKYGGRAYKDYREMYEKENLDAVYICIPPFAHRDEVHLAAEKEIAVFIEKPIALTRELAWSMVEVCKKHRIVTQVGYQLRHAFPIQKLKELIDKGELGRLGVVYATYICDMTPYLWKKSWWCDKTKSGGQVVEQVTHTYDLLRFLFGEPTEIYAYMNKFWSIDNPKYTVEDAHIALLKTSSGAIAAIIATNVAARSYGGKHSWFLVAEKATVEFSEGKLKIFNRDPTVPYIEYTSQEDLYMKEDRIFIECVKKGRETPVPIEEGAKTLDLTLKVVESWEKHAVVK
ncbi:MAG: hypothetical protein DRJ52_04365 [Thermoprotei archaeon]|nr:MAG: hypothetical protein DRJ52_04365 [Thermoprotei archaeon]HDI74978.1 Gfo/Idh/MocA family oxidoreductase [Thermoprotei archaeon]